MKPIALSPLSLKDFSDFNGVFYLASNFLVEPLIYIRPIETKESTTDECAVLECSNSESALSGIRWYKNSKPISADDKRYVLAQGNRLLIIAKTTDEDDGLYTCEMENSLGQEKLMIKLSIHERPIRIDTPTSHKRDKYTYSELLNIIYWVLGTSLFWLIVIWQCRRNSGKSISTDPSENGCATHAHIADTCTDPNCFSNRVKRLNAGIFFDRNSDTRPTKMFPKNALNMHSDSIHNENEALLGNKCFEHQPDLMRHNNLLARIRGIDKAYRQHNVSIDNTSTVTCTDEPYSSKTKISSLSSSCNSIPALSFNSSHELDTNKMRNYESLPKNFSNVVGNSSIVGTDRPKPNIHTNELNELISSLEMK